MNTFKRPADPILLCLAKCLFVVFALIAAFEVAPSSPTLKAEERPNVLVILVDDMGYSDPSFMGGEVPTPNLDLLAKNGLRFTQCYNSARCCPSRAALATGLYPHQSGIGSFATSRPGNRGPAYLGHLNDQCVTFAEVLADAGYQTYMVGKWHMEQPGPIARGFHEFYGYTKGYEQNQWDPNRYVRLPTDREPELIFEKDNFYATDAFTDYSLEFLKQARQKKDKPWLLYLAHSSPHFPVQAPKESVDKFVETYRKGWDVLREDRFSRMKKNGLATDSWDLSPRSLVPVDREDIANGFPGKQNPAWSSLPQDRREDLSRRGAIAAAMLHHVDQGIGKIVADLKNNGELENTLILFMSDNGACYEWGPFGFDGPSRKGITKLHKGDELKTMGGIGSYHSYGSGWANLGNTPFQLYKHFCSEGGNCTPMVAHWPKGIAKKDRWVREPVHLFDVMPTLCEVAKTRYPTKRGDHKITPVEGKSLVKLFNNQPMPDRFLFSEHQEARSVRHGPWKAVWSKRMPRELQWELYNIADDRSEINDVASDHPDLVKKLESRWMEWANKVKVYPFFDGAENFGKRKSAKKKSPMISNREFEVSLDFSLPKKESEGVIVAQGGRQHGYSLHIEDSKLVYTIRIDTKTYSISAKVQPEKDHTLTAQLFKPGEMILKLNGKVVATGKAPSLITTQPQDALSIGKDDDTAVGSYTAPFPFDGKVKNFRFSAPKSGLKNGPLKKESPAKSTNRPASSQKANAPTSVKSTNFVLIFIDDMGWGDFSSFGNKNVTTENIDRMAKEGMRFTNFYVNSPICSPSRVAISTGMYPQRYRIGSYLAHRKLNQDRGIANWLDPKAPMLARELKKNGYRTGHFGKWHMGGQRDVGEAPLITEYGFDQSLTNFEGLGDRVLPLKNAFNGKPPGRHGLGSDKLGRGNIRWQNRDEITATFTEKAINFMKDAKSKGKPFYVNVWPDDVHSPFFPPKNRRGDQAKRTLYHGVLDTMDEQLGKLFDFVRGDSELSKNTMILICSDNGPELGAGSAGPFRGFKTHLYEGGVRSPLIVWAPHLMSSKAIGSENSESIIAAFDLVPSLLEVANCSTDIPFDGKSMAKQLLGSSRDLRSAPIFFRRPPDRDNYYGVKDLPDLAVRSGKWKLLCEYDGSDSQLFDLSVDPGETRNVFKSNSDLGKQLRSELVRWHESMPQDNGLNFASIRNKSNKAKSNKSKSNKSKSKQSRKKQ